MLSLFFAFIGWGHLYDFREYVRDKMKELDVFTLENLVVRGFMYSISLLIGILSFFYLGSFTLAIGYKLFY